MILVDFLFYISSIYYYPPLSLSPKFRQMTCLATIFLLKSEGSGLEVRYYLEKDGKKIRVRDGEVECAIISRVKRRAVVKLLSFCLYIITFLLLHYLFFNLVLLSLLNPAK